jgi:hypothetical protein
MVGEQSGIWFRLPVIVRAVVGGVVVGMAAANVWPILLVKTGMPVAAVAEVIFLALYVWWFAGGGPPTGLRAIRADYFRAAPISPGQWVMGMGPHRGARLCGDCECRARSAVSYRAVSVGRVSPRL